MDAPGRRSTETAQGAVPRVACELGRWAGRRPTLRLGRDVVIMPMWTSAAESDSHIAWADDLWRQLEPWSTGGVYVNYLSSEGAQRVQQAYGSNFARLVALKRQYDPDNVFRCNQNVTPA